jgi:isopenicillin-N N-acyltransferase-like protein
MEQVEGFFVKAYGDPAAVGRQIGERLAEPITNLLARLCIPQRFSSEDHRERLASMLHNIERIAPHLVAEMEGIAAGADVPADDIFMLNCLVELACVQCSVFGFADAPGGPLIGKTDDLGPGETTTYAVCVEDVPGKAQILHVTWPGTVWGGPGVNERGVGFAAASVATGEWNEAGLPSNMVSRIMLENARDLDEAIETLMELPLACHPFNCVIADEERMVALERSVYKTAVRELEDGAVWATNHFLSPDLAELVTRPQEQMDDSRARYEKLSRRVNEKEHSVRGAQEILMDHTQPGAVCRHGEDHGMVTRAATIIRPRARVVWLALGRPCESKFRPYQLQLPVQGGSGHLIFGT